MESSSRQASTRFDAVKWVVVVAVIAVGVVGNYYFGNESLLYRTLAMVALALVAGFIALQTDKGRRIAQLMKEAKVEIRRSSGQPVRSFCRQPPSYWRSYCW